MISKKDYNDKVTKAIVNEISKRITSKEDFTALEIAIAVYNKGLGTIQRNKKEVLGIIKKGNYK